MAKRRFSRAEAEWARRYQQDPATAGPPPAPVPSGGSARQVDPLMQTYNQHGIIPPGMIDRAAPDSPDPLRGQLLGAMTGVSALPKALDTAFGARAVRGIVAGNPREGLSMVPGSDQFGLTDPRQEQASHFGFLGDTLLTPDVARLGMKLGRAGVTGIAEMLGNRAAVGGLAPEAAQFVPRPPVGRSPLGTYIERTTPGAAPRLRPKGNPPVVTPPEPGGPAALSAPPRLTQLPDLDPVRAYDKLTAGWRDPLAATVPRSVADPGRATAQGARASKAFGKISAASNRVPDRPIPAYQPPPEAVAAHADPSRVVGSEQAAQNIARRATTDMTYATANSPGNVAFRAAANIGGLAQRGGNYLMGLIRGQVGGGPVPGDKAAIGFMRPPSSLADPGFTMGPSEIAGRAAKTVRDQMARPRPAPSIPSDYNSVSDLMRNGSRMYKEVPTVPGSLADGISDFRGVGGTPAMKSPAIDQFGLNSTDAKFGANPDWQGFATAGNVLRPGIAGVRQPPPGAPATAFGQTVRHERTHAIMQEAMRRGRIATNKLPTVMQVPTRMQMSANPVVKGLGVGFDEAAARAMEARNPMQQGSQGMGFLFNDSPTRQFYAQSVGAVSPTARHLFEAMPQAARASGTAAVLAPAALLNAIRNGSETNGGY